MMHKVNIDCRVREAFTTKSIDESAYGYGRFILYRKYAGQGVLNILFCKSSSFAERERTYPVTRSHYKLVSVFTDGCQLISIETQE